MMKSERLMRKAKILFQPLIFILLGLTLESEISVLL